MAVPEKHGSTGNERPKTRFLANNFGNGGPIFGPLCRIMRNYTADIFTIDLAGTATDEENLAREDKPTTDIRETCT